VVHDSQEEKSEQQSFAADSVYEQLSPYASCNDVLTWQGNLDPPLGCPFCLYRLQKHGFLEKIKN